MAAMPEEMITSVEQQVGIVQLNRPAALNALNQETLGQLGDALRRFDDERDVRCILLTGGDRVFASGSDVNELARTTPVDLQQPDAFRTWDLIDHLRKPLVAAVSGYALGSGCGLVLACDIVIASETARFGQPELNLGIIPGVGGTQRLVRTIGRARTMDMILTGRMLDAHEAAAAGIVSRVVPRESVQAAARQVCQEIVRRAPLAVQAAKDAVRQAHEMALSQGLAYERKLFTMLFATDDQREGMRAFLEKRPPFFAGR